tara:strand:- start:409 stop:1410 length:1002 start_codon:yes stop_codon:yes gene_type:complete
MALTKISTGGVKDDAASQAIIADEAVDEARLQISNAGSNGQFLSKQSGNSGGLTWADGASEGTEVKSTGESGTTKFLRVDGDGTSSWQVPPDTVYTHPNHSGEVTSTADGAQVIADDVVDEANLKVSNSPTNGQFLSAQSGNTGGLTWASVSAGPWTLLTSGTKTTSGAAVIGDSANYIHESCSDYTWFELHWFYYGTANCNFGFNFSTSGTGWLGTSQHVALMEGAKVTTDSVGNADGRRSGATSDPRLNDAKQCQYFQGVTRFNNPSDTTRYKMLTTVYTGWQPTMAEYNINMIQGTAGHTNRASTDALKGLAFFSSSGYGNPVSWRLLGA